MHRRGDQTTTLSGNKHDKSDDHDFPLTAFSNLILYFPFFSFQLAFYNFFLAKFLFS